MSEALLCLTETFYFDGALATQPAENCLGVPVHREILPQKREATNMLLECAKRREHVVESEVPYSSSLKVDSSDVSGESLSEDKKNENSPLFIDSSNSSSADSGIGSSQNSSPTHSIDTSSLCLSEEIRNCMDVDVVPTIPSQTTSAVESTARSTKTSTIEDLDLRLSYTHVQDCPKILKPCFIESSFKDAPPLIYFATKDEDVAPLPENIVKLLKWKLSTITPAIIKEIVTKVGFSLVEAETTEEWLGTWGKHLKCSTYKKIQHFQKVNHFPGGFHLGRKDRLWQNYRRMASKHPGAYDFFPETFLLPAELAQLKEAWDAQRGACWIVKPCASARGCGVRVVGRWSQVPKAKPVVVQRYLSDPFLLGEGGSKFDLRLYACVTSVEPLRVYLYGDGLVRFASQRYSLSRESLSNRFVHLTNYSINRKSATYAANDDETACQGHKWSLKSFWRHLSSLGVSVGALQSRITDLIVKTILSCESPLVRLHRAHAHHCPRSCFELFGFDVLLDSALRPWLIEVNISPSLHTKSALDSNVKGPLVRDMLNLTGFPVPGSHPPRRPPLTPEERRKHAECTYAMPDLHPSLLSRVTGDDVRCLRESEGEAERSGGFSRVFPTPLTRPYLALLEHPRYYTGLLQAWEERKGDLKNLLEEETASERNHDQS